MADFRIEPIKSTTERLEEFFEEMLPSYVDDCPSLLVQHYASMREIIAECDGTGKYASRENAALKVGDKRLAEYNRAEKLNKIDGLVNNLQKDIPNIRNKCNPGKFGIKEIKSMEESSLLLREAIDKKDMRKAINIAYGIEGDLYRLSSLIRCVCKGSEDII